MLRAKSLGLLLCLLLSPFAAQASYIGGAGGGASNIITTATDYYVCAKGAGGTCVYNGNSNAGVTPSDSNNCLTATTPCATIAGVATLINGSILDAVVTIHLADTAGTGTDCYRPNDTKFQILGNSRSLGSALENAGTAETEAYPSAYLYLLGNTTTPASVIVTGATTCAGTTANDLIGIRFSGGTVRVRGIQAQYFAGGANGPDNGAFNFYKSYVYAEDLNCTGSTAATATLLVAWEHSIVRMGNAVQGTISSCNVLDVLNLSHGSFITPLGRANLAVTLGTGWAPSGGIFTSNEKSHIGIDGLSLTVSGSGTARIWFAIAHASITWNDDSTFVAPAQTHSYNGAGITMVHAIQGGYVQDLCRTAGSLTCNIGNTTAIAYRAKADQDSYVSYNTRGTSVTNQDLVTSHSTIIGATNAWYAPPSSTFANLGTPANGAVSYCSDCTFANPCAGAGTGALAKRLNGAWRCD